MVYIRPWEELEKGWKEERDKHENADSKETGRAYVVVMNRLISRDTYGNGLCTCAEFVRMMKRICGWLTTTYAYAKERRRCILVSGLGDRKRSLGCSQVPPVYSLCWYHCSIIFPDQFIDSDLIQALRLDDFHLVCLTLSHFTCRPPHSSLGWAKVWVPGWNKHKVSLRQPD